MSAVSIQNKSTKMWISVQCVKTKNHKEKEATNSKLAKLKG